jgi:hypothetical protein
MGAAGLSMKLPFCNHYCCSIWRDARIIAHGYGGQWTSVPTAAASTGPAVIRGKRYLSIGAEHSSFMPFFSYMQLSCRLPPALKASIRTLSPS